MSERKRRTCKACGLTGHNTGTCLQERGKRYGDLTVRHITAPRGGDNYASCQCACGVEKDVRLKHLHSGAIKSCGCFRVARLASRSVAEPMPPETKVDVFGQEMTVSEAAALVGRRPDQVWARLRRGATAMQALFGNTHAAAIETLSARGPMSVVVEGPKPLEIRVADLEERVAKLSAILGREVA